MENGDAAAIKELEWRGMPDVEFVKSYGRSELTVGLMSVKERIHGIATSLPWLLD